MTGTATAIRHIENERTVITEWRFKPGDNTGWHRHAHDYAVVPLVDGRLKLVDAAGESFAELRRGVTYYRSAGVEHDVVNASDHEIAFVEIEYK